MITDPSVKWYCTVKKTYSIAKGDPTVEKLQFIDKNGSFQIQKPENVSGLYFPLASEAGLKSAITPNLGGDAKTDQVSFLLEPTSIDNLHNNRSTRNFWCVVDDTDVYSACGASAAQEADKFTDRQDESSAEAGLMWHTLHRSSPTLGIASTITSFTGSSTLIRSTLVCTLC